MKQTAVEWLIDMLVTENEVTLKGENYKLFEMAKAMEKEQLCYFYVKGAEAEINNPYVTNIEFYNKTFKSK